MGFANNPLELVDEVGIGGRVVEGAILVSKPGQPDVVLSDRV